MAGASVFDFQPGQAEMVVRGIASAVGGDSGLSDTQAGILGTMARYGFAVDTPVGYVDDPIDDVRSKLALVPKGAEAVAAGSLPAMDPNAVFGRSN
jgi:hypothetical protein